MASKNGSGGQALKTDPTMVTKRTQIPNWAREVINRGFAARLDAADEHGLASKDDVIAKINDDKKRLLAYMNGLLKNQKSAD